MQMSKDCHLQKQGKEAFTTGIQRMAGSRGSSPSPAGLTSIATGVRRTRILRSGYVRAPRARRNKMANITKRFFGKSWQEIGVEIERDRLKEQEEKKREEEAEKEQSEYQKSLAGLSKEELDSSFQAFIGHPDFSRILNQVETIEHIADKWSFILRRAYEIGQDADTPIGFKFQYNPVEVKRKLEDYGLYLLCPYFREDDSSLTKESCLIDGNSVDAMCGGEFYRCVVFEDRARKAAAGTITLPVINRQEPKIRFDKISVEPVDLRDLENWWKQDGEY